MTDFIARPQKKSAKWRWFAVLDELKDAPQELLQEEEPPRAAHASNSDMRDPFKDTARPERPLQRPHTSNPKYSRLINNAQRSPPKPSEGEKEKNSEPHSILWASDGSDLEVGQVARPRTSNPWLSRFVEQEQRTPERQQSNQKDSQILWSANRVDDWTMLVRPRTSNPAYQAATEVELDTSGVQEPPDGSEVLWSRDDTVADLHTIIMKQQARILELEAQVVQLSRELIRRVALENRVAEMEAAEEEPKTSATQTQSTPPVVPIQTPSDIPIAEDEEPEPQGESALEAQLAAAAALQRRITRPGTAGLTRQKLNVEPPPQIVRPQSAPIRRSQLNASAMSPSVANIEAFDDDAVHQEYCNMLRPGLRYVLKSDYRTAYAERAQEFGMTASTRQLDSVLRQYKAAGPEYLTVDEFAVLYLKLAQW